MPQIIKVRRSTGTSPPVSLEFGELAWSENGVLYIGRNNGTIVPLMQAQVLTCIATEAISANALINIFDINSISTPYPANSILIRNADAGFGYEANGFIQSAVNSGDIAFVHRLNSIPLTPLVEGSASLVKGASYFLSTSPGRVSTNQVSQGSGHLHQRVGVCSGGRLITQYNQPVLRI